MRPGPNSGPRPLRDHELGAMVREIRQRTWGLTQREVSRRSGLSPETVSQVENGNRVPSRPSMLSIARALELPDSEIDRLLIAAGYLPLRPSLRALVDEPVLWEIAQLLVDPSLPEESRALVRAHLRLAAEYARAFTGRTAAA